MAEAAGFSVVREYVGHAIGTAMHEQPQVPNYWPGHKGPTLKTGMVFVVEPMVNAGTAETRQLDDGWSVVTADGRLSAHFEHTIAVTPTARRSSLWPSKQPKAGLSQFRLEFLLVGVEYSAGPGPSPFWGCLSPGPHPRIADTATVPPTCSSIHQ